MKPHSPYIYYQNQTLTIDGVSVEEIATRFGTPSFVYSASHLRAQAAKVRRAFDGMNYLCCYAVKANSNLSVLKLFQTEGLGMDIVSYGEYFRARRAGCEKDKIVFSGVGKTKAEIESVFEDASGSIHSFHVESLEELTLLGDLSQKHRIHSPIAIRFNPEVDAKTHPYITTGLKKNKFGLSRKAIQDFFKENSLPAHLQLKGISIHIGSQVFDLSPFKEGIEKTLELIDWIEKKTNSKIEFIDLGGGWGMPYDREKEFPLDSFAKLVSKALKGRNLKILLEPGRWLVGNSGLLITRVIYNKRQGSKNFLIVDAAMNDLIRPPLYEGEHQILPVSEKLLKGKKAIYDVVGPICESADFLAQDRELSSFLNHDDLIAVESAGAYCFSMSSQYNSRPRAPEVLIDQGSMIEIRPRETYEDLIRGEL